MRITKTTSRPVSANETTAAGPAELTTTPLPTNNPAPMTPPSAIICMWRRCSPRLSPVDASTEVAICPRMRRFKTPAMFLIMSRRHYDAQRKTAVHCRLHRHRPPLASQAGGEAPTTSKTSSSRPSDVGLVFLEEPNRFRQRIAPERVAEFLCHHQ